MDVSAQEIRVQSTSSLAQTGSPSTDVSEGTESLGGMQRCPTMLIQLFAQIMTGLHFLESVGATFILWLCPGLAPEPRIHRYIASLPHSHHHQHHGTSHSRSTTSRRRNGFSRTASDDDLSPYHRDRSVSAYDTGSTARPESHLNLEDERVDAMSRTESWARMERELLAAAAK
ncbi:hypothetical protein BDN70DRAFT_870026 [Pholiota conissans]|uniref:Uncharacterized protein n=1 Tax=Pholiota conissans TaxID=109636 RepID=A0A9P6D8A5_9AGAR|nr:hypothetical protein BDN70DRAFT_870026 [Pholiota conissans]